MGNRSGYITLDGNFSKTLVLNISLRRGKVPVLVIGSGSRQPRFTNIETNSFVVSCELSPSDPEFPLSFVEAKDNAAFAYDKDVRPS